METLGTNGRSALTRKEIEGTDLVLYQIWDTDWHGDRIGLHDGFLHDDIKLVRILIPEIENEVIIRDGESNDCTSGSMSLRPSEMLTLKHPGGPVNLSGPERFFKHEGKVSE